MITGNTNMLKTNSYWQVCFDELTIFPFFQSANHKLTINLLSQRTWCNVCDCEVFPDVIIKTKASMVADHPPPGGRRQISIQGGQERITHPHQQHHHHGNTEDEEMEHSGAAAAPEYYPQ